MRIIDGNNNRIEITTHGDLHRRFLERDGTETVEPFAMDPGVEWAIRQPREAEQYCRRLRYDDVPVSTWWTRLKAALKEAW